MKKENKGQNSTKYFLTYKEIYSRYKVTKRCLVYWEKKGLINSSKFEGKKVYKFREIIQIKTTKNLKDRGVSVQKIGRVMERLRRERDIAGVPLCKLRIATEGSGVYLFEKGKLWNALNGQLELFHWLFEDIMQSTGEVVPLPKNYKKLTIRDIFPKHEKVGTK